MSRIWHYIKARQDGMDDKVACSWQLEVWILPSKVLIQATLPKPFRSGLKRLKFHLWDQSVEDTARFRACVRFELQILRGINCTSNVYPGGHQSSGCVWKIKSKKISKLVLVCKIYWSLQASNFCSLFYLLRFYREPNSKLFWELK